MKKQTIKALLTALAILSPMLTVSGAGYYYSTGTERNTLRALLGEDQEATFGQKIQKGLTPENYTPARKYAGKLHLEIPMSKLFQGHEEKMIVARILTRALKSAGIEAKLGWSQSTSIVDVHAGPKTLSCLDEIHDLTKKGNTQWMRAIKTGEWPRETCADDPEDREWWVRLLIEHDTNPYDFLIVIGVLLSITASLWTTVVTVEKLYRERNRRDAASRR